MLGMVKQPRLATVRMINFNDHPVAWALLAYELSDARDHLDALVTQMANDKVIDEIDFRIQVGHIYSHLNRAWHGRDDQREDVSQAEWEQRSRFPTDITPV